MLPQGQSKSKPGRKKTNPQITKPESSRKQSTKMKSGDSKVKVSESSISPPQSTKSPTGPRTKNPRFNPLRFKNEYLVDIKNYKIISKPKHGGCGMVNFVQEKNTGEKYAAKTSLFGTSGDELIFIIREINILLHFQHETVIQFHGISYKDFNGNDNITVFMKYMENGSLADILKKERRSLAPLLYDNTKKQMILVGIARGMMLLHKHHIIHRDLKPDNVLLDDELKPHITDFGLSKIFDPLHSKSQTMFGGTLFYMAPEIIRRNCYNIKADVYAFGILMYEVVTGNPPFKELLKKKELSQHDFEEKVLNGIRPKFDAPVKKGLKKMIELCWSDDPKSRPSFAEIYSKLSCADESFYIDSENSICKPLITLDDDDDDNDDDSDDDDNNNDENNGFIHSRYCFDDVDIDELFMYVDDISNDNADDKNKNGDTKILNKRISDLEAHNEKIEETIKTLTNDNEKLKKEVADLKKIISNSNKAPRITFNQTDSGDQNQGTQNSSNEISQKDLENQCIEISKKVKKGQLKNVVLPDLLKKIPNYLFKECRKLESVKIPSSVIKIGSNAFEGCLSLKSIILPNGLKIINCEAFLNCSSIVSINIPSSVEKICYNAFEGCSSLTSIEIPSSVKEISYSIFNNCSKLTTAKILSDIIEIPNLLFASCKSLKAFEIPSSVQKIGGNAFNGCSSLANIEIPSSVEIIEERAFYGCSSLTSLIFPNEMISIGNEVLEECTSLIYVKLPSSLTEIPKSLFRKCESLKTIEIPSSVTSIGENAFSLCSSLVAVEIPSSVISIEDNAFSNCNSLKEIEFPSSVETIGNNVFQYCNSLKTIKIPSSLNSIGKNAFPNEAEIIKY